MIKLEQINNILLSQSLTSVVNASLTASVEQLIATIIIMVLLLVLHKALK